MRHIAFIDFETTGVDFKEDVVIEGAVVLTELTDEGRIGNEVEVFQSFNDPKRPIPPLITRLTGITDEQVAGQTLDWAKLAEEIGRADFIVAHNAGFDRAWVEKEKITVKGAWACSSAMIDWRGTHGMPCGHLKHLAWEHNFFPNAHRALDDVRTLVRLLDMASNGDTRRTYLQEMLARLLEKSHVVLANGAPFDSKDKLKQKRFRWSGSKKVWWKIVKETELPDLTQFLTKEVYLAAPTFFISEPVDPLEIELEKRFGLK